MKSYFKNILIQPLHIVLTTDSGRGRWTRTAELIRYLIYKHNYCHYAIPLNNYLSTKNFEPLVGFEPTTTRLQITCSGQLS